MHGPRPTAPTADVSRGKGPPKLKRIQCRLSRVVKWEIYATSPSVLTRSSAIFTSSIRLFSTNKRNPVRPIIPLEPTGDLPPPSDNSAGSFGGRVFQFRCRLWFVIYVCWNSCCLARWDLLEGGLFKGGCTSFGVGFEWFWVCGE